MPQEMISGPVGLYTDPNPLERPNGALELAQNIILRRQGVAQPRPGLADATYAGGDDGIVRALFPYKDLDGDTDTLAYVLDGSTHELHWASDGDDVDGADSSSGTFPGPYGPFLDHTVARGRLLLTCDGGPQWLDDVADSTLTPAGLPRMSQSTGDTSDGVTSLIDAGPERNFLTSTDYVAYRAVLRRKTGDYLMRSPPSGRWVVEGDGAADRAVDTRIPLPKAALSGDIVELYRSPISTAAVPSDELFLALSHTVTATDISNGYIDIEDRTPVAQLGEALYTNPGQQTITQENNSPPEAAVVAQFGGSTFYGNARPQARLVASLVSPRWGYYSNSAYSVSGDTIDTDESVTSSDTDDMYIGQFIAEDGTDPEDAGTNIDAETQIDEITSGTTFEMTLPATGTATEALHWGDIVRVTNGSGVDVTVVAWAATDPTVSPPRFGALRNDLSGTISARAMAENLCYVLNYQQGVCVASVLSEDEDSCVILFEQELGRSESGDQLNGVNFSNPSAWDSEQNVGTEGAGNPWEQGFTGTIDRVADGNRLYWSKPDQPEAVPLAQFANVGDAGDLLHILSSDRALYICKEDGIWALTGDSAFSGWRLDRVSTSVILAPRCAVQNGDAVYVWTDDGAEVFVGRSKGNISRAQIGVSLRDIEQALHGTADPTAKLGAFLAFDSLTDELFVGVPDSATDEYAATVYVYNVKTQAWGTWEPPRDIDGYVDIVQDPSDGLLRVAVEDTSADTVDIRSARSGVDWAYDRAFDVTVTDITGATVTISAGSGWTPTVGDVLELRLLTLPVARYFVVSVDSATEFDIDTSGVTIPGGEVSPTWHGFESFECKIVWPPLTAMNPSHGETWRRGSFVWETLGNDNATTAIVQHVTQYTVGLENDANDEASFTVDISRTINPDLQRPTDWRVPRGHARSNTLTPSLTIQRAGAVWALTKLVMTFEKRGPRHRRQYA